MAKKILEFFGYDPDDRSPAAKQARAELTCPFLGKQCVKTLNDGKISGVCTLQTKKSGPVICCPIRLYAREHEILRDVSTIAFGSGIPLLPASKITEETGKCIAVFGKGWGKELRLPNRGKRGSYFMDWVLAHVSSGGKLVDFVAVEVQSIDTTGNYRAEREAHLKEEIFTGRTTAGLNWENVNKRILPQLIFKGHVLRQEPLCQKGLFFVCPTPVYHRITVRLGGALTPYPLQPGTLTFMWYDIGPVVEPGNQRMLVNGGKLTTTIDQVAMAFTGPRDLPPPQVYEKAIRDSLKLT
jgi:hypothetical protein